MGDGFVPDKRGFSAHHRLQQNQFRVRMVPHGGLLDDHLGARGMDVAGHLVVVGGDRLPVFRCLPGDDLDGAVAGADVAPSGVRFDVKARSPHAGDEGGGLHRGLLPFAEDRQQLSVEQPQRFEGRLAPVPIPVEPLCGQFQPALLPDQEYRPSHNEDRHGAGTGGHHVAGGDRVADLSRHPVDPDLPFQLPDPLGMGPVAHGFAAPCETQGRHLQGDGEKSPPIVPADRASAVGNPHSHAACPFPSMDRGAFRCLTLHR